MERLSGVGHKRPRDDEVQSRQQQTYMAQPSPSASELASAKTRMLRSPEQLVSQLKHSPAQLPKHSSLLPPSLLFQQQHGIAGLAGLPSANQQAQMQPTMYKHDSLMHGIPMQQIPSNTNFDIGQKPSFFASDRSNVQSATSLSIINPTAHSIAAQHSSISGSGMVQPMKKPTMAPAASPAADSKSVINDPNFTSNSVPHSQAGLSSDRVRSPLGVVSALTSQRVVYGSGAEPVCMNSPNDPLPRVQDALGYLEKVKNRFSLQPLVYNQFLDIMKDFKAQTIDTEGVIKRVKTLFKGHLSLILGFNQFLPAGYRIDVDHETPEIGSASAATPTQQQQRPNIEFNHAVQYVAKIKNRFREQPAIYTEFLDILHDYQAKRTLEEVYQRVQKLFNGQADLLNEFKYFLPDNAFPSTEGQQTQIGVKKTSIAAGSKLKRPQNFRKVGDTNDLPSVRRSPSSGTTKKMAAKTQNQKKPTVSSSTRRILKTVTYPPGSDKDLRMFDDMRAWMSKSQWMLFLKALNLFANDIITCPELIRMFIEVTGDRPGANDWLERLKQTLGYDLAEDKHAPNGMGGYYTYISSVDLTTTPAVTTSYRQLPATVPIPQCSGRTALGEETLNDTLISIPTGSEDFSFSVSRRNVYEENLFKCEDERYELDMLIENNRSAIQALEPLVRELKDMPSEAAKRFNIEEHLDILHLRSMSRIYGEQAYEIIELLKNHPVVTASIVLDRLKQKEMEWRKVQFEMRNPWRRIFEQNFARSLDHRSFYFKQEDKRRRTPKVLVQELREVHNQFFGNVQMDEKDGLMPILDSVTPLLRQVREGSAPQPKYNFSMRFKFEDAETHHVLMRIIAHVTRKALTTSENIRFMVFMTGFIHPYFNIGTHEEQLQLLDELRQQEMQEKRAPPDPSKSVNSGSDFLQIDSADDDADGAPSSTLAELKKAKRTIKKRDKRKQPIGPRMSPESNDDDVEIDTQRIVIEDEYQDAEDEDHHENSRAAKQAIENTTTAMNSGLDIEAIVQRLRNVNQGNFCSSSLLKPMSFDPSVWELEERHNSIKRHDYPSTIIFASNAIYVFFRLYQFLYERLHIAHSLAHKSRRQGSKKKAPSGGDERWAKFIQSFKDLIEGSLDSAKFEDECRNLMGASAYVLFNLDKLAQQLVKQANSLLQNDVSLRLLDLYQFELGRSKQTLRQLPADTTRIDVLVQLTRSYLKNAVSILQQDHVTQIEYFIGEQELCVGLVDRLPTPEKVNIPSEWAAWFEHFKHDQALICSASQAFLFRNITAFCKRLVFVEQIQNSNGENFNISNISRSGLFEKLDTIQCLFSGALKDVIVENRLQLKLDVRNYRPSYMDDTCDVLFRIRKRSTVEPQNFGLLRAERFSAWASSKFTELFKDEYLCNATEQLNEIGDSDEEQTGNEISNLLAAAASADADGEDADSTEVAENDAAELLNTMQTAI